ncbi:MurR/RpiR family transcriptional regulator [Nocardioidaceae bacterium SCSIO 66511]|nr:MurR/RpiR family transcriptional regulator [Nocardioidaceae bacterium SCSIO 66511]
MMNDSMLLPANGIQVFFVNGSARIRFPATQQGARVTPSCAEPAIPHGDDPSPSTTSSREADSLAALFEGKTLTPAHRRIAHYLLTEATDDVAYQSVTAIADRVGVSQPSVSRFATAVGFPNFAALRKEIRRRLREAPSDLVEADQDTEYLAIDGEVEALRRLRGQSELHVELQRAVEAITASPVLPVVGLRISAPLAAFFAQFAFKILPDVHLITGGDSQMLDGLERSRRLGATAAVVLCVPRYPTETAEAMRFANSIGLEVILISDSPLGVLADLASVRLWAPVNHRFTFDSPAAHVTLLSLLLDRLAESVPGANERLEAFDQLAQSNTLFLS